MTRVGILSIVRGDSPSMIERRLQMLAGNQEAGGKEEASHLAKAA
ncbi:hypothetical protein [Rhodothermus marinus]|nr:hypothetical protein [Rhodothermus marinus]